MSSWRLACHSEAPIQQDWEKTRSADRFVTNCVSEGSLKIGQIGPSAREQYFTNTAEFGVSEHSGPGKPPKQQLPV